MMTMFCPKCGTESPAAQKFCRQCGLDLNVISQVIKGQTVIDLWRRAPMIWGVCLLGGSTALGCVVKLLNKEGIRVAGEFTPYVLPFLILTLFAGLGLICYSALGLIQHQSPPSSKKAATTSSMNAKRLPAEMPAITEHTTDLFEEQNSEVAVPATAPIKEKA